LIGKKVSALITNVNLRSLLFRLLSRVGFSIHEELGESDNDNGKS